MAEIRSQLPSLHELGKQNRKEESFDDLIKSIVKDKTNAVKLRDIKLETLSPAQRSMLSQFMAEQLRGQIPPKLAAALNQGTVDLGTLGALATRLGNTVSGNPADRAARAATPEAARAAAANPELPHQALQWARFVQMATNIQGGGIGARGNSAAPKGEQTVLAELIAQKLAGGEGPGLRNPRLVARAMQNLSPEQRTILMNGVFGTKLANALRSLGITDPIMFVKAGALPEDRAALAAALGIPRGRLLGLLMRAELLKIGPGRNGELPIKPEFLSALKSAGIAMLGTLAALRGLSFDELKRIYNELRNHAGGFSNVMKGGRVPVKRDLLHWARTAAHRKSDILLADSEEYQRRGMGKDDAAELIAAWYMENLLWDQLQESQRQRQRIERDRREREERQRQEQERQERERQQRDDEEDAWYEESLVPELLYDEERDDRLMCFWVTDESPDPQNPGLRRMYVCVDPETGAIIPQYIDKEDAH